MIFIHPSGPAYDARCFSSQSMGVPALAEMMSNMGPKDDLELSQRSSNQLVDLPYATAVAWGMSGKGCVTCCEPCGRTPEHVTAVRAAVLAEGLMAASSTALVHAMGTGRSTTPSLAVLGAYAPFDPAGAVAALPAVRSLLLKQALNAPADAVNRSLARNDSVHDFVKAGCSAACNAAADQAKEALGAATSEQEAAMVQLVQAVHCAVILAALTALPGSGLDAEARLAVASEALAELATVGAKIAACTHPSLADPKKNGPKMRSVMAARVADAVSILAAVVAAEGAPSVELNVAHHKDLRVSLPCGPCGLISGKPHDLSFIISRWDTDKLPPAFVHSQYNIAPPVRIGVKGAPMVKPPLLQAMGTVPSAVTMNPLRAEAPATDTLLTVPAGQENNAAEPAVAAPAEDASKAVIEAAPASTQAGKETPGGEPTSRVWLSKAAAAAAEAAAMAKAKAADIKATVQK